MSNVVPEGWAPCELGALSSKIEGGGTPSRLKPEFWGSDIPWATVKDLKSVRLANTQEFITSRGLSSSSSKLIPAFTPILASRMAVGKVVVFDKPVAINQDLKAFYPTPDLNWEYFVHWYISMADYIEGLSTGSTVKGIRLDDLKVLPVDLPPLPEQKKIAAILTSVDEVIEKTQAQIDKLKDLKTAMMQELLTCGVGVDGKPHTEFKDSPVGRIPKGWEVKGLGLLVHIVDSLHQTPTFSNEGYPMVRVSDIKVGKINLNRSLKVNQDVFKQFTKKYKPKKGDLLMSRVGSYGVCSYIDRDIELCIGQNTVVIDSDNVNSLFLYYVINSGIVQNQIEFEVAGSGYKSLSLASIRALKIPMPSEKEQERISESLSSIDQLIEVITNRLIKLHDSKKALMQDLLTGKVRVKVD